MKLQTFIYSLSTESWSTSKFADLDSPRTLVLAFGAPELQNGEIFQALRRRYPSSVLVGCSTAGEVFGSEMLADSLALAVVNFERTDIAVATAVVSDSSQSNVAGHALANRLLERGTPAAMLLLADGVNVEKQALVDGLVGIVGTNVPLLGVFAADGERFDRPWVLVDNHLQSGLCAVVGLYGNSVSLTSSVTDDWGGGPPTDHVVTRANGNIVAELDGRPALELCRGPSGLKPLRSTDRNDPLYFIPLWVDVQTGSVAFDRAVPQGSRVLVLEPDPASLIRGAAEVARTLHSSRDDGAGGEEGPGRLAIAIDSLSRRLFLGSRAPDEILSMSARLPPGTHIVGLYSYGVAAPNNGAMPIVGNSQLSVAFLEETEAPDTDVGISNRSVFEQATRAMEQGSDSIASYSGSRRTLVSSRSLQRTFGDLNAGIYDFPNLRLIVLEGTVNENFDSGGLAAELKGRVVLDLGGIDLITSFGVRGWLDMMSSAASMSELYLSSASEAVVNQMLMVRNFGGGGQVLSFRAPYICTSCSDSFEFTLDTESLLGELFESGPPDVACRNCGNRAVFDDDPESYFEFILHESPRPVPADIKEVLAERRIASMTQVEESIQKRIEGARTSFTINRDLDQKIRWERVFSGAEGAIRIDFSGSRSATEIGAERMLMALKTLSKDVHEILLDQVDVSVVERLIAFEEIRGLDVRSLRAPATCMNCGVVRHASLTPIQIREAKRHGVMPESACRRCGSSIPVVLPRDVIDFFMAGKSGGPAQQLSTTGIGGIATSTWILIAGLFLVFLTLAILVVVR